MMVQISYLQALQDGSPEGSVRDRQVPENREDMLMMCLEWPVTWKALAVGIQGFRQAFRCRPTEGGREMQLSWCWVSCTWRGTQPAVAAYDSAVLGREDPLQKEKDKEEEQLLRISRRGGVHAPDRRC